MLFFGHQVSSHPLSSLHPFLYWLRVYQKRLFRFVYWYLGPYRFAKTRQVEKLPFRYFKHQSKLIKKLGETEMDWQINKVTNLRIAINTLNGVLLHPGQTFSFHKLVGKPTRRKGYLEGMELSFGKARAGIGGGLCQLSNLIHWMVLHTPLKVLERSNHSFDPFPDEGRVLPFGSGAALFYNYVDLMIYNPTSTTFQVNVWLTEKLLEGEIRSSSCPTLKYHIYEKNHKMLRRKGRYYRTNEIWQDIVEKGHNGKLISSQCLYKNFVVVSYQPHTWEEELTPAA